MSAWIYPISKKSRHSFELAPGSEDDVSVENYKKLIESGKFPKYQWWYITRNYDEVELGNEVYIYAGVADQDLGIIGYATVEDKRGHNRNTWELFLNFDLDKCRMLLKEPIPAPTVRHWIPYPRNAVWPFPFQSEIALLLPWRSKKRRGEKSQRQPTPKLYSIISEINSRARTHSIGKLQEIRKQLKGLKHLPAKDIFTSSTTFDRWAFHHGGRKELQFNVGIEHWEGIDELRYGVAFSLETSQSLPSIEVLVPKVKLFNDFMQLYSEEYADMRMWHYTSIGRSTDYMPTSIPHELVTKGVFIFLGKRRSLVRLDYELLLDDLDRLLPLYKYIESDGNLQPISAVTAASFEFRPGCTPKTPSALVTQAQKELDINLRHNALQEALYRRLIQEYGAENVGTELQNGVGTSVDVVVRQKGEYWFYEIKTAHSPRACIRQALGQLLEYAFWPGAQVATRLIIIGEEALDKEGAKYLRTLRDRFSLPVEYEQIAI
jgi:hypothetical protein